MPSRLEYYYRLIIVFFFLNIRHKLAYRYKLTLVMILIILLAQCTRHTSSDESGLARRPVTKRLTLVSKYIQLYIIIALVLL